MFITTNTSPGPVEQLSQFVYELLDAHADTLWLADELPGGKELDAAGDWPAHVLYLRDLQRVGRALLAHLPSLAANESGVIGGGSDAS